LIFARQQKKHYYFDKALLSCGPVEYLTLLKSLSMNITDIIDLFKLGKASAKSHMRNLIEIAAADGRLGTEEQRLLEFAAVRNNISKEQLKEIQANTVNVRFKVPGSQRDKFNQLYDLVHMMTVDKNIHAEELRLCEIFAIKFGYRKETVREMIELIRQNIEKWIGAEETMQTVLREMKVHE
jgi:uncharacterized tellurite resistance protein B-like protein